tara:strand:- start:1171 stop:1635 length:465 start_codon:yes stop_codon:yes gene_type:complete
MGNKKVKIFNNLVNLIKDEQKIQSSIHIAKGKVLENWIDYNDHMNMSYYVQCFEESSDFILEHLGLGYNYAVNQNKGVFVVKCEINYKKEIKLNEEFLIALQSIVIKGKRLTLRLVMKNDKNNIFADYEILNLNIDLKTKKSISFEDEFIRKLS